MEKKVQEESLFCLDNSSNKFDLKGSWLTSDKYTTYDIWLTSCSSYYKLYDGSEQGGEDDCVWDLEEVRDYLGNGFFLSIFHNQQEFKQSLFGEDSIEKKLVLTKVFTVSAQPSWTETFIQKKTLADETSFVQLG